MSRVDLRAYAARWLRGKGVASAPYKGLGRSGCINFECGCSIFQGTRKGWGRSRRHSVVCAEHVRALGTGAEL